MPQYNGILKKKWNCYGFPALQADYLPSKPPGKPHSGILLSDKKNWTIKTWKGMMNYKCILLSERTWREFEKTICSIIPTIWHSRRDKIIETVKRSVAAGFREMSVRDEYVKNRELLGGKIILYETVIVAIWHYALAKTYWTLEFESGTIQKSWTPLSD